MKAEAVEAESEALEFLRDRGFSAKRAKAIAMMDAEAGGEREEGEFPRTAWDMTQAITAAARALPNSDTRMEMEKIAGRILDKVA